MDSNNFSGIEHMMELGLGVGLAQQMMRTMNECMQQTSVPTVGLQAPNMPQPPKHPGYYVAISEQVAGPFDEQQLTALAKNQQLLPETYVWSKGMAAWTMAKQVPEVNKVIILSSLP